MKKIICFFSITLLTLTAFAQENDTLPETFKPNAAIKWSPTALFVGSISLLGEYNFGGKSSLTAKIGIPAAANYTLTYEGNDANFNMKAFSFLAGYRMYFGKRHMRGLYFEPYFSYVHHTSEGVGMGSLNNQPVDMLFVNKYSAFGVGGQLGAQFFIGKRFVIDFFFLGPELNSVSNNFRALETTNTIPWNSFQSQDAERSVRDFINEIPFIRNRTTIMVDNENRSITADFKGALPGFRAGVSLGIAL